MAREPRTQIREKSGPLLVFASERGPCAPVREGGRSAKNEIEKEIETNHKIKKEKRTAASSVGCGTAHPRTRREATSRHTPGPGGDGGMSQSEGREEKSSSRRGRLGARETGGDATRVTRGNATRGKGRAGGRYVRKRAVNERKKGRKKIKKKTHQMAAASRHTFVSGRTRRCEKAPLPRVCEQEGVPYAPVRETVSGERKRNKKGRCVPEQRRERGEGRDMSQKNVGK